MMMPQTKTQLYPLVNLDGLSLTIRCRPVVWAVIKTALYLTSDKRITWLLYDDEVRLRDYLISLGMPDDSSIRYTIKDAAGVILDQYHPPSPRKTRNRASRGYREHKPSGRWQAYRKDAVTGKRVSLGYYKTESEARLAYVATLAPQAAESYNQTFCAPAGNIS